MKIAEIFGTDPTNKSLDAKQIRSSKYCPFRQTPCTKVSKVDPLGVCSLTTGQEATVVCPTRFLENGKIFKDASRLAFGSDATVVVFPEYKLLTVKGGGKKGKDKKIGKVDFLIGSLCEGHIVDFAAIEVQAVYTSGGGVRDSFDSYFGRNLKASIDDELRVDFRSSAQKRLFPQLALKVPVFRRWGKKFFVVIDNRFFDALPEFETTASGNSEITWLSYPLVGNGEKLSFDEVEIIYSEWDAVSHALREGDPPESPTEVLSELQQKLERSKVGQYTVLKSD